MNIAEIIVPNIAKTKIEPMFWKKFPYINK